MASPRHAANDIRVKNSLHPSGSFQETEGVQVTLGQTSASRLHVATARPVLTGHPGPFDSLLAVEVGGAAADGVLGRSWDNCAEKLERAGNLFCRKPLSFGGFRHSGFHELLGYSAVRSGHRLVHQ